MNQFLIQSLTNAQDVYRKDVEEDTMITYQLETENSQFGAKLLEESLTLCIQSAQSRVKMGL